jgi:isoquinoline 1-oxidoreductase alpha subunit
MVCRACRDDANAAVVMMNFTINGQPFTFDGDGSVPLLWVIRERAHLTGTKFGCGAGYCGACTVMIEKTAFRSCVMPVSGVVGKDVTTIEGVARNATLNSVQRAWVEEQVPQCGYCQSGFIVAITALLVETPNASEGDIVSKVTNLCRCGTYPRIRKAISRALRGQSP